MKQTPLDIALDYHMASKNLATIKFIKNAHLNHYSEKTMSLMESDINKKKESDQTNMILLPSFTENSSKSFVETMASRNSNREFNGKEISLLTISKLLHFAWGYKRKDGFQKHSPTSGGLNSVELYVIVLHSLEIQPGAYSYIPKTHGLNPISLGNYSTWLNNHVFYQTEFSKASMIIILASDFNKLFAKYGTRAYRLSLLDVGHVSQNIYLTGAFLDINICASAGFIDEELEELLELDGRKVAPFLTLMIGA